MGSSILFSKIKTYFLTLNLSQSLRLIAKNDKCDMKMAFVFCLLYLVLINVGKKN